MRAATDDTPSKYEYVLVLMDDFSRFTELVPAAQADADTVAVALCDWFKRYGIVRHWQSDQGTHFLNAVLDRVKVLLRAQHHFTAAYAPWSNGVVERRNKELREMLSLRMLEARLPEEQWPYALPAVNASLNTCPSPALAGYSPMEVFLGRKPERQLDLLYNPARKEWLTVAPDSAGVRQQVAKVQQLLAQAKEQVGQQRARKHVVDDGVPVDFTVGDYVLTAMVGAPTRDKTRPLWGGPAVVVSQQSIGHYTVKDIATGDTREYNARHLKRYADKDLVVTDQLREFAAYASRGLAIDRVLDHRWAGDACELLVAWEVLDDSEQPTSWEPMASVMRFATQAVKAYVHSVPAGTERSWLARYFGNGGEAPPGARRPL